MLSLAFILMAANPFPCACLLRMGGLPDPSKWHEQASAEKMSALTRLSAAEATAEQAFMEVGDMRDQLNDLKERLNQVPAAPSLLQLCPNGTA